MPLPKAARKAHKDYYKVYESTDKRAKNKLKKLRKHCLQHSNDLNAKETLENGTFNYPKRKSVSPGSCKSNTRKRRKNPLFIITEKRKPHPFKILCTLF